MTGYQLKEATAITNKNAGFLIIQEKTPSLEGHE
jgi:hypothetical protein